MNPAKTPMEILMTVLSQKAFDYIDETACQNQMERYLESLGVQFRREYSLSPGSRVDFYFPNSGIGLEVKANKNWGKMRVYRQLERYAESNEINGLILATGKAQSLPDQINGKPVMIHNLGVAHL